MFIKYISTENDAKKKTVAFYCFNSHFYLISGNVKSIAMSNSNVLFKIDTEESVDNKQKQNTLTNQEEPIKLFLNDLLAPNSLENIFDIEENEINRRIDELLASKDDVSQDDEDDSDVEDEFYTAKRKVEHEMYLENREMINKVCLSESITNFTYQKYKQAFIDCLNLPNNSTILCKSAIELKDLFKIYVFEYNRIPSHKCQDITELRSFQVTKLEERIKGKRKHYEIVKKINFALTDIENAPLKSIEYIKNKHGINSSTLSIGYIAKDVCDKVLKANRLKINDDVIENILSEQNNMCCYCKSVFSDEIKYNIDHKKPLANGGSNRRDNLQALCVTCHMKKTEEENNMYQYEAPYMSTVNNYVYKLIQKKTAFHRVQMVDYWTKEMKQKYSNHNNINTFEKHSKNWYTNIHSLDLCKCRRNIMMHSPYEWPVYSCLDNIEKYDKNYPLKCGMYYVSVNLEELRKQFNEQDLIILNQGSLFYSKPIVEYMIELGLITLNNIKYQYIPSRTISSEIFKQMIDCMLDNPEEHKDIGKLLINALAGIFGRT